MLDYAGLEALAAVVREGSFERAAHKLHVTPSAVSQRIKQLEERVGQALVLRGQPCTGTEAERRSPSSSSTPRAGLILIISAIKPVACGAENEVPLE